VVSTRGERHLREIRDALRGSGYEVETPDL
jgi:hypothetical protein